MIGELVDQICVPVDHLTDETSLVYSLAGGTTITSF